MGPAAATAVHSGGTAGQRTSIEKEEDRGNCNSFNHIEKPSHNENGAHRISE
jgi:hypothetical protein